MPTIGVSAVVISSGKVLLIKRRDFEVWALPGGMIEAGETLAQAAVRETQEETGIEIELTRLVGIYSSPKWHEGGDHAILFAAHPKSDVLKLQPEEVIEAGYFLPSQLPEPLVWWHQRRIRDAFDGVSGAVCLQDRIWPWDEGVSRSDLYEILKKSELSPQEFFLKYLTQAGAENEYIEVNQATRE